jgi:hypothetical protein
MSFFHEVNMSKTFLALAVALLISSCAMQQQPIPPIDVGEKLVLPADHTYVVPPQGIRFSNGFTVGVQNHD